MTLSSISPHSLETWLLEGPHPHRLNQIVDRAGRHALDVGLLDHRSQRLLGHPPRLQEAREVAPLPQLRDLQLDRAGPRLPGPVAVAVSTFFPRAITATRSFVREASAPAASCILSGVVQELPGPSRLRLRVGRLQHPPGLEKEPRSGCVRRQALASVRGQRNGCQLHAWSKTIPECQSQARARTR